MRESGQTIRTIPIDVATRAPSGTTNAYVVGDVLVDPAAPHPTIDAIVADGAIAQIAVTHTHADHVGAVADYARETDATVWAHEAFDERFKKATEITPDRTFREGETIGSAELTVIETPGHASDHVAFAVASTREDSTDPVSRNVAGEAVLCGDLAVSEGSVVVGPDGGGLTAYLESLRRIRDRSPGALYPGHGPRIDDPQATLDRLIDHRLERERRVLATIERGADDVDAVVTGAYEKDLTGVEDLARATVRSHLEKLLTERRIDESWRTQV